MLTLSLNIEQLDLETHGAQLFRGVLDESEITALTLSLTAFADGGAGVRLFAVAGLAGWLAPAGLIGRIPAQFLGAGCFPVRAISFDKSASSNWGLSWHQDRTIAVKQRLDVPGFGPWSIKNGVTHVEPPIELLSGMLTIRVHLDPVPSTNAPLLVAPGSHDCGRIPSSRIGEMVRRCGTVACLAEAGDVWVYATPILHASEAAINPTHRRVLQVDYAASELPCGLEWLGI